MEEWWVAEARRAIEAFRVLNQDWYSPFGGAVVAEAGTGSLYEVYAKPVVYGVPEHEMIVTVYSPWMACAKLPRDGMLHPDYVAMKLRGCESDKVHPGDLYGVLAALSTISPVSYLEPEKMW